MGQNECIYTLYLVVFSLYRATKTLLKNIIVNRPGVAGAILQSSLSLTDSFIHSFIEWSFSSESLGKFQLPNLSGLG